MSTVDYPIYLQDFASLAEHFNTQFEGLDSYERGVKFARFVEVLFSATDIGANYPSLETQPGSHDNGVDLIARDQARHEVWVQSKYRIRGKDELDSIFSKFRNKFESDTPRNMPLFPADEVESSLPHTQFMIVTASNLANSLNEYRRSRLSSVAFYERLASSGQLHIWDLPRIYDLLRSAYVKSFVLPESLEIEFVTDLVRHQNVHVGIIRGGELKRLYRDHGDSLFFENIRDYLYDTHSRKTSDVNREIANTIEQSPEQMLARNNGIVFKARSAKISDSRKLQLQEASIVNGCQTTMSIVMAGEANDCCVLAKIVSVEEGWDVAKTANRQNEIGKLELTISEFLRPQRVKKAAASRGVAVSDFGTALAALNSVNRRKVVYEDLRSLFVGIFSRTPNNLFESSEDDILTGVMDRYFNDDPEGETLFDSLFTIQHAASECSEALSSSLESIPLTSELYKRFFKENIYSYRAYLTLLACSAASQIDISSGGSDDDKLYSRRQLVEKSVELIENSRAVFDGYFKEAFKVIVFSLPKDFDEDKLKQALWSHMKKQKFSRLMQDTIASRNI